MDPNNPVPLNPKNAHADYLAGWLWSQVQAGPITVDVWNKGVRNAEAFAGRMDEDRAGRAALGKRNAMAARRRTGGKR